MVGILITLDHTSSVPLYQQIVDQIKAKILSGELDPGTPLPSIRQLASDLLTSVITTKRAYQELEAQGLINTLPGRGSFVSDLAGKSRQEMGLKEIESQLQEVMRNASNMGIDSDTVRALLDRVIDKEGADGE